MISNSVRVFLRGGLGNQLFGWAAGYALATKESLPLELIRNGIDTLGRGPLVSRRAFELGAFGFFAVQSKFGGAPKPTSPKAWPYRKVCQLAGRTVYLEPGAAYDPSFESLGARTDLHGYFQSWLYFSGMITEVRAALTENFVASDGFLRLHDQLSREPWLAVHVRLGDYRAVGTMHSVTARSLRDAGKRLRQETGIDKFVLFSDDVPGALELFPGASKAISAAELPLAADSLVLMGLGSGNIYSNSTFSWWSAMLHHQPGAPKYFPDHWNAGANTPSDGFLLPAWSTFRT